MVDLLYQVLSSGLYVRSVNYWDSYFVYLYRGEVFSFFFLHVHVKPYLALETQSPDSYSIRRLLTPLVVSFRSAMSRYGTLESTMIS